MTHALDETYGLDQSIAYVGKLPWHQFGTRIPAGLSVEEAISACPAIDFKTLTAPLYYLGPDPAMDGVTDRRFDAKGFRAIVRDDTGACLGVASDRYKPIQIREQWKGLDPLIEAGLASIETLGSIEGGKRTWGLVKLNASEIPEWAELEAEVGKLEPYALAMDDKTGKRSALIAPTSVRVVCRNTLEAGIGGLTNCVKVRHVGDTTAKIEAAAEELWGGIVTTFKALAGRYRVLASATMTDQQHELVVQDQIAVIPSDPEKFASPARYEGAVKRAQAKREAVHDLWFNGAAHSGNRSAWEALNGAIEAIDHNRAGAFREPKNDGKIASMLTGTEAHMKSRVTESLVAFAQERAAVVN